jgi:hypothetical protein
VVHRPGRGEEEFVRVRSPWDLATVDGSPYDDSTAGVAVSPELGEGFGGFRRTERGGDHRLRDGRPFGEGRSSRSSHSPKAPSPTPSLRPTTAVAGSPCGGTSALAHLDAEGNLTTQIPLGDNSEPHGLALDFDGSVWVALEKGSLAHIQPRE